MVLPTDRPDIVAYAMDYAPDEPTPLRWSRVGWVFTSAEVDGTQLTGPIVTMPGAVGLIAPRPVVLDYRWLNAYPAVAARYSLLRASLHVVPFAPAGVVRLWQLT